MKYLVVENGYDYDDNFYNFHEDYTALILYDTKEKAEEKARILSYEKVFSASGPYNFTSKKLEIGPQFFDFYECNNDSDLQDLILYLGEENIPFKDLHSFRLPKKIRIDQVQKILELLGIEFYHVVEVEEG